jgi:hypothetical protein
VKNPSRTWPGWPPDGRLRSTKTGLIVIILCPGFDIRSRG